MNSPTPRRLPATPAPHRPAGRHYVHRQLEEALDRLIQTRLKPLPPGRLLDYGCGQTPYRPRIEPWVSAYLAADLPDNPAAALPLSPKGCVPLEDESVDSVLSTQVLEHVPDPARYLAECHRLLRPGGQLILSTHGVWRYHPHPTDLWRWTSEGLRHLLSSAGFEIQYWEGLLGRGATGVLLLQDALVPRLPRRPRRLRPLVARCFQAGCALADRLHSQADRDTDASIYLLAAERLPLKPQGACL